MRRFLQLVMIAIAIGLMTASPVLAHGVPNE